MPQAYTSPQLSTPIRPFARRTVGPFRDTLSAAHVLALALLHHEIIDETIVVDLLAVAEHEHPAANDPLYSYGRTLAVAPPRPTRVPALRLYEEYHPHGTSAYRAVSSGIEGGGKRYRYGPLSVSPSVGPGLAGASANARF